MLLRGSTVVDVIGQLGSCLAWANEGSLGLLYLLYIDSLFDCCIIHISVPVSRSVYKYLSRCFCPFLFILMMRMVPPTVFLETSMAGIETVPKDLRNLRACLLCSLVKTVDQFEADGCENCERYLNLKNDREKVLDCTSLNFDGLICLMDPQDSWVAKWQKINRGVKGVYAVSVSGGLPQTVIRDLKSVGINYRDGLRDTTTKI